MQLRRIPSGILIALGLTAACGPEDGGDTGADSLGPCLEVATSACLRPSVDDDAGSSSDGSSTSHATSDATVGGDTGSTGAGSAGDTTFGPCLDIEPTTGDGSGSDSGDGETTVVACLSPSGDEPAPDGPGGVASPPSQGDGVLDRVLSSGRLPADVTARLRRRR